MREISTRLIIKIEPWSDFQPYESYLTSKLTFLQCLSISRRMQYLIFNWRQLGENTADQSTSGSNSSRAVENQTMVLFWLLIGLKFHEFWYINHHVLKKKVFHLIRGWTCDVMKPLHDIHCNCGTITSWIRYLYRVNYQNQSSNFLGQEV